MSTETVARKNVQLSTTVTPELHAALRKYRFENEIEKMGEVLTQALSEFVASKGIKVATAPAEAPAK